MTCASPLMTTDPLTEARRVLEAAQGVYIVAPGEVDDVVRGKMLALQIALPALDMFAACRMDVATGSDRGDVRERAIQSAVAAFSAALGEQADAP